MKSLILALAMAVLSAGLTPMVADAKRIGGGSSAGMQRSLPAATPPAAAPGLPAAPAHAAPAVPATAAAQAATPRRSWMGPIGGLAAGLGIAALMSHFGMGAEMGNIVTMLLFVLLALFAIRFVKRRFALAAAGAGPGAPTTVPNAIRFDGVAAAAAASTMPSWSQAPAASALRAGFDNATFERSAKMIFIRMQAANDSADLNDLRAFTTPEMFASIKLDLQDRGASAQQTDVVRVDAEVLDVASEAQRQIVSVRFHGLIRENRDAPAAPFDEVWHLVKPLDGSHEWAIAGIQQTAVA